MKTCLLLLSLVLAACGEITPYALEDDAGHAGTAGSATAGTTGAGGSAGVEPGGAGTTGAGGSTVQQAIMRVAWHVVPSNPCGVVGIHHFRLTVDASVEHNVAGVGCPDSNGGYFDVPMPELGRTYRVETQAVDANGQLILVGFPWATQSPYVATPANGQAYALVTMPWGQTEPLIVQFDYK